MPLAFTNTTTQMVGIRKQVTGTVTFDNSYPTGGEPFTPAQLGLGTLERIQCDPSSGGYIVTWDRSTSAPKLLALYGDNNNAADGPLIEVPNTTNLSTLVTTFTATGW